MADPTLGPGAYLAGLLWLAVVGTSLVATAARTTARAVDPGPARVVAGAVVALAQVTVTAQVLGGVGLLRAWPYALATLATALAVRRAVRPDGDGPHEPAARAPRAEGAEVRPRWEAALTGLAVVAVATQWTSHTADALQRGMTHADTLWYHGPFSARFLQMGSLADLGEIGYLQARYYPLGSELLHTVAALPFHRDVLSPLVNLGFLALALGASWVAGERFGAASPAVLATATAVALPTLAGTQAGQASNDIVVVALLLAAIALLLRSDGRPLPLGIAGAALGLAVGTKVTVVAMAATLLVWVAVEMVRRRRWQALRWWILCASAPALAWPLRNAVVAGHPAPFWDVSLGPIQLDAVAPPEGTPSVVKDLLAGSDWSYAGGLHDGFGPLWAVVLLGLVAGPLVVLVRGPAAARPVAAAVLIGAAAYTVTPLTGGSSFKFNLRYLMPPVTGGLVLLAIAAAGHRRSRWAVMTGLVVVLAAALLADHHERVPAWPGSVLQTVVAGAVVAAALVAVGAARSRAGHAVPVAVVAGLALAGWFVQQHHLDQRYVRTGLHDDRLNAAFRTVRGAEVGVLGTPEVYPFFGADLSNEVHDWSPRMSFDAEPRPSCRSWRTTTRDHDWVVVSTFGFALGHLDAAARASTFEADPAVSVLFDDGERAVYQLDGPLDPDGCP